MALPSPGSAEPTLTALVLSMRRTVVAVLGFSLVTNLLMLMPSVYMLQIYDRVLTSRNETTLFMVTLILLVLFVLLGVVEWVRSQLLIRGSARLDERLRERVFAAAFAAALSRAGSGAAQALTDLTQVRQFVGGAGLIAFFELPWVPIYLIVIALLHPYLGLFSLGGAIVLVVLTVLTERLTAKPLGEANALGIKAANFATNSLRNAEVVEAMGMQGAVRRKWEARHVDSLVLQEVASNRAGSIGAATRFARLTLQSLSLGVGAWLVIYDQLGPGSMIAASILMGRLLAPIEQVIGVWRTLAVTRTAYERLVRLLEAHPAREPGMPLPRPAARLSVDNVSAAAPGSQQLILKGVSFTVAPGEILGVIGASASGKSTLARLLVGVWPAGSGKVRLDGADVYAWNKAELGPHLGYLPQEVELFEGSVAENIARLGTPDPDAVIRAAGRAGIHEMILALPQKYDTEIGAGGAFLSGGQRQRVALARALYGDPVLVVLDEPNSNLDDTGEAALMRALKDLKAAGAAVVVIAHRPNVLAVVDNLLVLREGQRQAFGPRSDVIAALTRAAQKPPEPPPTGGPS